MGYRVRACDLAVCLRFDALRVELGAYGLGACDVVASAGGHRSSGAGTVTGAAARAATLVVSLSESGH